MAVGKELTEAMLGTAKSGKESRAPIALTLSIKCHFSSGPKNCNIDDEVWAADNVLDGTIEARDAFCGGCTSTMRIGLITMLTDITLGVGVSASPKRNMRVSLTLKHQPFASECTLYLHPTHEWRRFHRQCIPLQVVGSAIERPLQSSVQLHWKH